VVLVVVWLVHELRPNPICVESEGTHQRPLKYNPLEWCLYGWFLLRILPYLIFKILK